MASLHDMALTRCIWAPKCDPKNTDKARSKEYEF